jgi:hypothetical protein
MELDRTPWWARFVGLAPARVTTRVARSEGARREESARRQIARQQRKAELVARRAEVGAAKRQVAAERAQRQQVEEARLAAEQLATQKVATRAFEAYVHVREHVRRMRDLGGVVGDSLTPVEQQMVSRLAHLWDATADTIAHLRRWCEPITGVRAADYEPPSADLTLRLKRDYRVLRRQVGSELFVEEPRMLGGFGYERNGQLINEDTLKHFSGLVALQDGAVLGAYRHASGRRLVWEIGGGWGGFAHQFKTLCPNVTYLITGLPELLLVSAVYLMTAVPDGRFRFYGDTSGDDLWDDWEQVDFVFASESALPALRPPRMDLALDIVNLRNMNLDRVRFHVRRAFDLGSPYFYSLLPANCPAHEVSRVWKSIEALYWPHPVPARAENMPPVVDGEPAAIPDVEYAHLVAWRRLRA